MKRHILGGLYLLAVGVLLMVVSIREYLTISGLSVDRQHGLIAGTLLGALLFIAGFLIAIDFPRGGVARAEDRKC